MAQRGRRRIHRQGGTSARRAHQQGIRPGACVPLGRPGSSCVQQGVADGPWARDASKYRGHKVNTPSAVMKGDLLAVGAAALSSLAYERKDASVYRQWQKLGETERRDALENKYVMLSVARHVTAFLPAGGSADAGRVKAGFQQAVHDVADNIAREGRSLAAEWFEGLGIWAAYLIRDGELQWAEELL